MIILDLIRKLLVKNPLVLWALWFFRMCYYSFRGVNIRYMSVTSGSTFERNTRLDEHVYFIDSTLGLHSYVAARSKIERAEIGKYCCIGPDVRCGLGGHPTKGFISSHPLFFAKRYGWVNEDKFDEYKKTHIGNDVWIGAGVIIIDGVTIGNGAIIAAGSIVSKDLPPYGIYGGIPAKHIKDRFSKEAIDILQNIKWWDLEESEAKKFANKYNDIDELMMEYSQKAI